jgi:hypothetical protein
METKIYTDEVTGDILGSTGMSPEFAPSSGKKPEKPPMGEVSWLPVNKD